MAAGGIHVEEVASECVGVSETAGGLFVETVAIIEGATNTTSAAGGASILQVAYFPSVLLATATRAIPVTGGGANLPLICDCCCCCNSYKKTASVCHGYSLVSCFSSTTPTVFTFHLS